MMKHCKKNSPDFILQQHDVNLCMQISLFACHECNFYFRAFFNPVYVSDFTLCESRRGRPMIIAGGYRLSRKMAKGISTYWRCNTPTCKAGIKTVLELDTIKAILYNNIHNHLPQPSFAFYDFTSIFIRFHKEQVTNILLINV